MDVEKNKGIARRFCQLWGTADPSLIDELAPPEIAIYYPGMPHLIKGIAAVKEQFTRTVPSVFGNRDMQVEEVIAESDKVVLRYTFSATHQGQWPPGLPATGKRFKMTGITIYRIIDGKVVDERGEEDYFGAFRQLGLIPEPPKR